MVYAKDSELKISVEPLLPPNQITQGVKYFDLRLKPSEEQQVTVQITNHSSEEIALKIVYSEAKTTSQGVIEYSENKNLKINAPTDFLFTNIIKGPKNIKLKPKEVKDVIFNLKMPDQEFDGFIAGGIEFIQTVEKADETSSLKTQRSYLIGLRVSETEKILPIDLELNQTIVGTKNYKNAILIDLANQNAKYVEELTIQAVVFKKDDPTILLETKMNQVRIAPYSVLEVPIYLENDLLDPGDYQVKLTAKDKNKFEKEWIQDFKVTKKDAELLKENKKLLEETPQLTLLWSFITIGLIIVVGSFFGVKKRGSLKKKRVRGKNNVKK